MKWNFALAAVSAIALLSGCGSNSKPDGGIGATGQATISVSPYTSPAPLDIGGCVQVFVVHGIDDNGVPIPELHVKSSLIVQPKVFGYNGVIRTEDAVKFSDDTQNFSAAGVVRGDTLIIAPTPARSHPSYVGDWHVYAVNGSTLTLQDQAYNIEPTDQLRYYVGDERAYAQGALAVAHIDTLDDNGTVVTEDGYTYFAVVYDDALGVENVPYVVGAHIDGYRVGNTYEGRFVSCLTAPVDTNSSSSTKGGSSGSSSCSSGGGSCNKKDAK